MIDKISTLPIIIVCSNLNLFLKELTLTCAIISLLMFKDLTLFNLSNYLVSLFYRNQAFYPKFFIIKYFRLTYTARLALDLLLRKLLVFPHDHLNFLVFLRKVTTSYQIPYYLGVTRGDLVRGYQFYYYL